jgi:hypothetical protein
MDRVERCPKTVLLFNGYTVDLYLALSAVVRLAISRCYLRFCLVFLGVRMLVLQDYRFLMLVVPQSGYLVAVMYMYVLFRAFSRI